MKNDPTLFQRLAWRAIERMPSTSHERALLVTSARPGEGKTFIAEALAEAINAQIPGSVVLVECSDSRPPAKDESPGIAWSQMVAMGGADTQRLRGSAIGRVIRVPYGHGDAATAFRTSGITGAVDALRRSFGFVILDGPVLSQCGALGSCADATLLVINARTTRRETIKGSLLSDPIASRKLLGAVINQRPQYVPEWLYRRAL